VSLVIDVDNGLSDVLPTLPSLSRQRRGFYLSRPMPHRSTASDSVMGGRVATGVEARSFNELAACLAEHDALVRRHSSVDQRRLASVVLTYLGHGCLARCSPARVE
jgi:hypothetical protein